MIDVLTDGGTISTIAMNRMPNQVSAEERNTEFRGFYKQEGMHLIGGLKVSFLFTCVTHGP
jgi:hypothetical protein